MISTFEEFDSEGFLRIVIKTAAAQAPYGTDLINKIVDSDGDIVHSVITTAVEQAPYGTGKVFNFVIDQIFFPNNKIDKTEAMWDKIEKNMSKMVSSKVESEVQRVMGEAAASSMMRRLRNFGNLFRQLIYINNIEEKKFHLGLLTVEANNLLADLNNTPAYYLLRAAKMIKVMAGIHIATIMELKLLEPSSYRHQSSLNNMAILYSDVAAEMFHRSMAWRRSMVAEGKGVILEREMKIDQVLFEKKMKRIEFVVWDAYGNNKTGSSGAAVIIMKESEELYVDFVDPKYDDAKQAIYRELTAYDKQLQEDWTKLWKKSLLTVTQEFMNLVDWDGRAKEQNGEIRRKPSQIAYPTTPSKSVLHTAGVLERIDLFLEQQMDQFTLTGPRYVQTYRLAKPAFHGENYNIFFRADTYDTSMALIYLLLRGNEQRACDLGDGLVQAMNHDPIGGGRIVAASLADRLIDPTNAYATSIYSPDGGRRDIGNMSWAGIALTRLFHATQQHRYLHAAETIGQWILDNCTVSDDWTGFSGGEDHWQGKYKWRSVEHNVDCVSFFDNLYQLTNKNEWSTASESARRLVKACFFNDNYYITGTGETQILNSAVIPTDTQSWTSLAAVDPSTRERSLMMMISMMETTSNGFVGTKFAAAGNEIQNEATAGAAMALWLAREESSGFADTAMKYINSLKSQVMTAQNATGYGIVATPADVADTGKGLGWQYFNLLHVASSAWTGLTLLALTDENANPYQPIDSSHA